MSRIRDAESPNLATQRYGKGAKIFLTQQELEQAFDGPVGRVRYLVRPARNRTVTIHLQEVLEENANA